MQTELIKELNNVLKAFPEFWNDEQLHRSMVSEAISQKQPDLIKALVSNGKVRSVYGTDIDGIFIFDFERLRGLLKYKEYWANSFTKHRNKIGLSSEGKYLEYNSDVVLDFPFKDCILEGGMKDEKKGGNEIHYNEIIARDEIDTLLSPKMLVNNQRYTKNGVENNISEFKDDSLVIKGNNLIALSSIKNKYKGKISLIYIDPPYNTRSDSFKYNDSFNHSTWLTFIKPRLEIAKELLTESGSIWVSIDDNESHYLKVLMDEIFGRDCFIASNVWQKRYSRENREAIGDVHEYIFVYSKNPLLFKEKRNLVPITEKQSQVYRNPNNDPKGRWRTIPMTAQAGHATPDQFYEIVSPSGKIFTPPEGRCWGLAKATYEKLNSEGRIYFGKNGDSQPNTIRYLSEVEGVAPWTWWPSDEVGHTDEAKKEVHELFGKLDTFESPKPERLIERIINIATSKGEIVLDFFAGSATTASVALKLHRKFITIEQMNYIHKFSLKRLTSVISGEQGGISKAVNWQGGGSFVYAELMELNAYFVHEIQKAQSAEELEKLFIVMKTEAHLNYQVALENVLSAEYEVDGVFRKVAFSELELHEQKHLLIEILDKNQLYVNASDMDDTDLNISESDKAFTRSFYGKE